ncbi:hypothetical protein BDW59DRAFT_177125 [Aspergillus cavernicola]|uniref:Aminoglycoside phosphotransferase domain-containing protein n=1 Tax=Aspergillus cavernicola TaxID=176166 RepID=A0ABR4H4K3_9EURO
MGRVTKPSKATRFNEHMLKKLQKAVALDPEVDLAKKLPTDYSTRLDSMRNSLKVDNDNNTIAPVRLHEEDIRASLDASAPVETIFLYPLLKVVLDLLEAVSRASGLPSDSFSERLVGMMQASEILWRGPSARCKMVFNTTLQYFRQHRPGIPIPEPLGLLRLNGIALIFMSYQPGDTLTNPITTIDEFEQFLFKGYRSGGYTFMSLMRELCPPASSCRVVFTHGDLRPDNITVGMAGDHGYIVTGLIDWEYSGFYPEYYEAAKSTNCLSPYEEDDWYVSISARLSLAKEIRSLVAPRPRPKNIIQDLSAHAL